MTYQVTIVPSVETYYEIHKTDELESWSEKLSDDLLDFTTEISFEVNRATFVIFDSESLTFTITDLSDPTIYLGDYILEVTVTYANGETNTQEITIVILELL